MLIFLFTPVCQTKGLTFYTFPESPLNIYPIFSNLVINLHKFPQNVVTMFFFYHNMLALSSIFCLNAPGRVFNFIVGKFGFFKLVMLYFKQLKAGNAGWRKKRDPIILKVAD